MSLLRRCRVNAALTIQLFSQLFHFVNMWLFNRLVTDPESGLCSHYWGAIIRQQLGHVEAWAEKQGLELAADCHLSRIVQVGRPVLTSPQLGALLSVRVLWQGSELGFGKTGVFDGLRYSRSGALVCSVLQRHTRLTVQEAGSGVGRMVLCLRVRRCSPCGHVYLHTSTLHTHTCVTCCPHFHPDPFSKAGRVLRYTSLKLPCMNCRGHSSARSGW